MGTFVFHEGTPTLFMRLYLTICLFMMLYCSCSSSKWIAVQPSAVEINLPEQLIVFTSEIGEPVVTKELGKKYKALTLTEDLEFNLPTQTSAVTLKKNEVYILTKESSLFSYYTKKGKTWAIAQSKKNLAFMLAQELKESGNFSTYKQTISSSICSLSEIPATESNYKKQEFVYQGKLDHTLNFTYREYTDNLVTPSVTQELSYSLNDGKSIGYKGLRIEIISARNDKLTYKVMQYFK